MELTSSADPTARYHIVGPLFFNDDLIGVLDGKYVRGTVPRRSATGYRIEQRKSLKHPVIGLLVGVFMVCVGAPLLAGVGDAVGLGGFGLRSIVGVIVVLSPG